MSLRLEWGLIPAVPVPFRGQMIDEDAQRSYARWMAGQDIAGVAVWAHTGRGPHLATHQRRVILETWRAALPQKVIVAGANAPDMARDAKEWGADAVLAFPRRDDPVGYHAELARVLPVVAFYLYEAAGGVSYDDKTLHGILSIEHVVGIKVATLDSVMTFQRVAAVMREHSAKLLITGEDRFLGYSLMMGARAALIGMGSALTDIQAHLLRAHKEADTHAFARLSTQVDAFAQATFTDPMEGYIRRMLWALAAEGVIPDDACDDPWGPALPAPQRDVVRAAVRAMRNES